MHTDARVEADTFDDGGRIQALDLGIGVEFVEVADAEGQVGIGEELDSLGLLESHEEYGRVGALSPFHQQLGKGVGSRFQFFGTINGEEFGCADDDAAGVEVVVESLALAQELGREEQTQVGTVALVDTLAVAHGDGALDDHHGLRIDTQHEVNDVFNVVGIEEIALRVVVSGRSDNHEVGIAIGRGAIEGGGEAQRLLGKVFFDVFVLDGRLAMIDFVHLLGHNVNGHHLMVLGEEGGNTQTYIARTGYGNFQIFKITHDFLF